MRVQKLSRSDAVMERSPDPAIDIFAGDLVDQTHGGPVTIGYGRYEANQTLSLTLEVDDVMIVQTGRIAVTYQGETVDAVAGDIVYMPKGQTVTLRSGDEGANTAYVTYPHWATPN